MSYYDNQQWNAAGQSSSNWDQQTPPARSGANSGVPRDDPAAFQSQFEEVDRAIDNLVKSGKMYNMPGRRDSMPAGPSRTFPEQFDSRMMPNPRHHSVAEFASGDARGCAGANLQNYYASQRHHPSRGANEAEQVMQAKRRMAAQRERELRNYHQEQQYNRSITTEIGPQPNRANSPGGGKTDDERRDQLNRQRNALYGGGVSFQSTDGSYDDPSILSNHNTRPGSGTTSATGMRGHSPLAYDSEAQQLPHRSRANSNSSPSTSNPTSAFPQQPQTAKSSSRASTSSPVDSPHQGLPAPTSNPSTAAAKSSNGGSGNNSTGISPIGTRPAQNPVIGNLGGGKRSTTPQLSSPLSFGYNVSGGGVGIASGEGRDKENLPNGGGMTGSQQEMAWGVGGKSNGNGGVGGNGNGQSPNTGAVWGNSGGLGVQASVWG